MPAVQVSTPEVQAPTSVPHVRVIPSSTRRSQSSFMLLQRSGAGVHIGEHDPALADGPLVEATLAIAATARPGEVLVSRTVVDLVPGSGLEFADRPPIEVPGLSRPLATLALV